MDSGQQPCRSGGVRRNPKEGYQDPWRQSRKKSSRVVLHPFIPSDRNSKFRFEPRSSNATSTLSCTSPLESFRVSIWVAHTPHHTPLSPPFFPFFFFFSFQNQSLKRLKSMQEDQGENKTTSKHTIHGSNAAGSLSPSNAASSSMHERTNEGGMPSLGAVAVQTRAHNGHCLGGRFVIKYDPGAILGVPRAGD